MKCMYSHIPDSDKELCGYFESKTNYDKLDENIHYIKCLSNKEWMSLDNLKIFYFAGSFGYFHLGHFDIITRIYDDFKNKYENFIIVISPSNSDYNNDKYGLSSFSSNKERYDRIMYFEHILSHYNIVIDLDPMLNYTTDHPFTVFGERFKSKFSKDAELFYIGGKDRDYSKLNDYDINFIFYPEIVKKSTSKNFAASTFKKKNLILRCNDENEVNIFSKYFSSYYNTIKHITKNDEIILLKTKLKYISGKCATICKQYKDVLPYIKYSRNFTNPLEQTHHNVFDTNYEYDVIIDSDVFTGSTKTAITNSGYKFISILGEFDVNTTEIIDIDDFFEGYQYPYTDLSSRCSLPPFDYNMHLLFNEFLSELEGNKNDY